MNETAPNAKPVRRRFGATAIDTLVSPLASRALRRFGFTQTTLLERWAEVAGPQLAEISLPLRLSFAPGSRSGGTLTLQVEGPMATRLQHGQDLILERINAFFGYAAVERLRLVQGAVPARASRMPRPAQKSAPPPPEVERLPDGPLKTALLQLAATFPVDKGT
jgi:hypothetical protein